MFDTRILLLAPTLVLAGCAVTPEQCNVSNANASLIAKMNCDYSGGYSSQVRQRELELQDAQAENALFHQVYQDILAQQSATRLGLEQQQRQQADLDLSLGKLLQQLKGKHGDKQQVQQQINKLEADFEAARAEPKSEDPAELAARQNELKALQQQVSRLQLSLGYE